MTILVIRNYHKSFVEMEMPTSGPAIVAALNLFL